MPRQSPSATNLRVLPADAVSLRYADAVTVMFCVNVAFSKDIVTVKLALPTFPAASVAVHVTVVVPSEKLEPEDGEQVGPEVTATLSDAVTLNVVVSPPEPSTSVTVTLLGTLTTGGVASA